MKKDKEMLIEEMLLKNYDKYYRIAYGYVQNEQDALDIVQEGAYKAILNAQKLKNERYADTWICRIIMNEGIEYLRKNKRYFEDVEECSVGVEEKYEDTDLKDALERLSTKEKTVVMLRYFEDLSLEQVSQIVDENISTVKSRLYRALGKLKLTLADNP